MTPLVSIVVNNHDYGDYVCTAVDSALAQTHPAVEVVVVDDGSTDGSVEALRRYGDRVRLITQPQSGQTAALNAGFAACGGEIVMFLDADDALYPHAAATAVDALSRSDAVKAHGPLNVVDAAGRRTGEVLPRERLAHGDVRVVALDTGPQDITFAPTSGNAWRRSFLEGVMPLPALEQRLGIGCASPDALLAMLAAVTGPIARIGLPLGDYRVHGANGYAGATLEGKVNRHVLLADAQFPIVRDYCGGRGVEVDITRWQKQSWFHRLHRCRETIRAAVGPGAVCALVDNGEWGPTFDSSVQLAWFGARNGVWWGPPDGDDDATQRLGLMVASGTTHVVIAWQSFWWRDVYTGLFKVLDNDWQRLVCSDDLWVFRR